MTGTVARTKIVEEAGKLAVDVLYSEKGHFAAALRWSHLHYWLGVPATALAVAAGAALFSSVAPWLPSIFAFASGTLSALSTFLKPDRIAEQHHRAGVSYGRLRRDIRRLVQVDAELSSSDEYLANELRALTEETGRVQQESPAIPKFARSEAVRQIQNGSADYTESELRTAAGEKVSSSGS